MTGYVLWEDEGKAKAAEAREWERVSVCGWRDLTTLHLSHLQILSVSTSHYPPATVKAYRLSLSHVHCLHVCSNYLHVQSYRNLSFLSHTLILYLYSVSNGAVCVCNMFTSTDLLSLLRNHQLQVNIIWLCSAAVCIDLIQSDLGINGNIIYRNYIC